MGNRKDKVDPQVSGEGSESAQDAHHTNRDLSWERKARDANLNQAGSGGCSKGNGKGSHALPGLTQ